MIGETGSVQGDIRGSSIVVEGRVEGNLVGEERVVIRRTADVRGNVTAPRIDLEPGARLAGAIETLRRQ